jgi:hypothetical protein
MSLRRHLDREAIGHANADSNTHARHVARRKTDREITWIAEPQEASGASIFALKADGLGLAQGKYFIGIGKDETESNGKGFESHLASVNWQRRWNFAEMKRGERVAVTKRKRNQDACEEFVVNLAPWQMHFINTTLGNLSEAGVSADKRKDLLEALLGGIRRRVVSEFQQSSGRDVVGSYIHHDSAKVHFGVVHSRVGKDNKLVGRKYLGTVGAWSVAQSRIARLGLVDKADTRLKENLERFHARHGKERQPLDLLLHQVADEEFDKAVRAMGTGAERTFEQSKEFYRGWKSKQRRNALLQSPSVQRVAWQVLRYISPLLPPPLQVALSATRTASQAVAVISYALQQLAPQGELAKQNLYENRREHPTIPR